MSDNVGIQYHNGVCDKCHNNTSWIVSLNNMVQIKDTLKLSAITYICKECLQKIIDEWPEGK